MNERERVDERERKRERKRERERGMTSRDIKERGSWIILIYKFLTYRNILPESF